MDNKPINILVTGVGGDIGMGIIRCLMDIKYHSILVGCDTNKYAAGRYYAEHFYIAPKASEKKAYIDFLLHKCQLHKIDIVIPSSEQEIKVINEYRKVFNDRKIIVLINDQRIVDTFLDKYKTIRFFEEKSIHFPRTYLMDNYNNEFEFPFIVKMKETAGSKGVFTVRDINDWEYIRKKYPDSIVQEIIGDIDAEYTIGIFSNGTETFNIAFQRYLGFGSLSRQVILVKDQKIDQLATKIAEAINLKGSINVQVRKDKNGNYIPFEINPRLSSTIYFRHFFGFEDLKWWIDMLFDRPIKYSPKFSKGVGVRTLSEVFFDLKREEFENE